MHKLTPESLELFHLLALDAGNWGGIPCWGGNVGGHKADRGNLTDLKRKGLVWTDRANGCQWVHFTPEGKALAAALGVTL